MRIDVRAVDPDGAVLAEWPDPEPTKIDRDGTFHLRLEGKVIVGRIAHLEMRVGGALICRRAVPQWPRVRPEHEVGIDWEGRISDDEDWQP